jgi:hypothetical protein
MQAATPAIGKFHGITVQIVHPKDSNGLSWAAIHDYHLTNARAPM